MISSGKSSLSVAGNSASGRVAKIDALSKQANTLRQQLSSVQKPGAAEQQVTQSNSISQELVSIQSQIERLVLDGQLSKLTSQDEAERSTKVDGAQGTVAHGNNAGSAAGHDGQKASAKNKHTPTQAVKAQDAYSATKPATHIVDVQA
jgi:hypothetical protein